MNQKTLRPILALLVAAPASAQYGAPHELPTSIQTNAAIRGSAAADLNNDALTDYVFIHDQGGIVVHGPDLFQSEFTFAGDYHSICALPGGAADGSDALVATSDAGLYWLTYNSGGPTLDAVEISGDDDWDGATQLCVRSSPDGTVHELIAVEDDGIHLVRGRIVNGLYVAALGSDPVPPGPVLDLVLLDFLGDFKTEVAAVTEQGLVVATYRGVTLGSIAYVANGYGHVARLDDGTSTEKIAWLRKPANGSGLELASAGVGGLVGAPIQLTSYSPARTLDLVTGRFDSDSLSDAMLLVEGIGATNEPAEVRVLRSSDAFSVALADVVSLRATSSVEHVAIGDAAGDRDLDFVAMDPAAGFREIVESTALDGAGDRPTIGFSHETTDLSYSKQRNDTGVWNLAFTVADTTNAPIGADHLEVLVYQGFAHASGAPTPGETTPTAAYRNLERLTDLETFYANQVPATTDRFFHVPLYTGGTGVDRFEFLVARYVSVDGLGNVTRAWPANSFAMVADDATLGAGAIGLDGNEPSVIDVWEYFESSPGGSTALASGREITCVDPIPEVPLPPTPPPATGDGGDDDDNSEGGPGEPD